jgi:ribosomal protein L11 methylase PrmA
LDLQHHIFALCLGGELCVTKLTSPQQILDVGTGTGIWAIESGFLRLEEERE